MSGKALDSNRKSSRQLAAELSDLRNRLYEAEETLEAIRSGAVDAIVGQGRQGERIFTLQSADYNYRIMVENMVEGAVILDHEGAIIFSNKAFAAMAAKDMTSLLGMHFEKLLPQEMLSSFAIFAKDCLSKALRQEYAVVAGDARIPVSISGMCFMANGHNNLCLVVIDDRERKAAEKKLSEMVQELRIERQMLEEKNIALREVLSHIDAEKEAISSRIVSNVNHAILPTLIRLRNEATPATGRLLALLQRDLEEITSPFISTVKDRFATLSPREVEICHLIMRGMSSKEIAEMLCLSPMTIQKFRELIRKKLGLTNEDVNLNTYLHSFK